MKIAGWKISMATQIAVMCLGFGSAGFADEPMAGAANATATSESRTDATTTTPTAPDSKSTPTLTGEATEVAPGPLLEERKNLLSKIMSAKSAGCGVVGYLSAFAFMESMVRGGKPSSVIQDRIESISKALEDQTKRMQVLKTQRPTPPTPSQSAPAAPVASGAGASNAGTSALLGQLKQKYGDKIPASLSDIPADKLLNSDQGKEMLKKFLNK